MNDWHREDAFDVIVIGGGPSGLMAAIAAQLQGARTVLIEKGDKLGRKLAISGGGRCNVTNAKPLDQLMENIPGNGRFLYSALTQFSNADIRAYFESLGIALKEEDRGRVFPISDKAATVVQALVTHLNTLGVTVYKNSAVAALLTDDQQITGIRLANQSRITARAVVVATGGASVPQTGSTGDAYPWARSLGHTIIAPYPTEVPLTSEAAFIHNRVLQGLSFSHVVVNLLNGKRKRITHQEGDILFSHFGLTGPCALRVSHYVSTALLKNPQEDLLATIDFFPDVDEATLRRQFELARQRDGRKELKTRVMDWVPERLAQYILDDLQVDAHQDMAQTGNGTLDQMTHYLKAFPVPISGTLPLEKATVTGGGVSVKEVSPTTMASKLCRGLYFSGEVLDVHAHTGGYNITVAFSTGHLAGSSAAQYCLDS